jgi:hypothetical protein
MYSTRDSRRGCVSSPRVQMTVYPNNPKVVMVVGLAILVVVGGFLCKKKIKIKKRNIPMAQTTQDASFGPVFVIPGFCLPLSSRIS